MEKQTGKNDLSGACKNPSHDDANITVKKLGLGSKCRSDKE